MKTKMTTWVWIDSGECVDAPTKLDAHRILRQSNPGCAIELDEVLEKDNTHAYLKSIAPRLYEQE